MPAGRRDGTVAGLVIRRAFERVEQHRDLDLVINKWCISYVMHLWW